MASSKFVGLITCGICGNPNATVHEQQTGTKKGRLYYRCYSEINGSVMLCGTIQCIGQAGQEFINQNMRPIGQHSPDLPTLRPIGQPEPPEAPPAPQIEPIGQPAPPDEPPEPPAPQIEPISESEQETPAPVAEPKRSRSVLDYLVNG